MCPSESNLGIDRTSSSFVKCRDINSDRFSQTFPLLNWTGHSISLSMMEIDWIPLSIPVIVDESSWFNSSGWNRFYDKVPISKMDLK